MMFSSGLNCNLSFSSCSGYPQDNEELIPKMACKSIILNVYDMYWINEYTTPIGLSVFHSGVIIYGTEYAYGYVQPRSGIFEITPRVTEELGEQFRYRQSVHIGYTDFTEEDVSRIITELAKISEAIEWLTLDALQHSLSQISHHESTSPGYLVVTFG
ncbi:hypothetical protein P5V15_014027 [Pogonomyrmex californicus]